jgi:hypothetical protein
VHSNKEKAKEAERAAKVAAQGGDAGIAGRKSLSQQLDAAANAGLITRGGGVGGGGGSGGRKGKKGAAAAASGGSGEAVKFGRSAAAFGAIAAAGSGKGKRGDAGGAGSALRRSGASLKL